MEKFEYEYVEKQEDVRKHIQNCEGKHTQQVAFSTFHHRKNHPIDKETRKKISKALSGREFSKAHRENLSRAAFKRYDVWKHSMMH